MPFARMITIVLTIAAFVSGGTAGVLASTIKVENAWARASIGSHGAGAAYFTIRSVGGRDRLIGAKSRISKHAQVHTHKRDGNVFKMRRVPALDIPAGGKVTMKPGGHHVMFIGLVQALKEGTTVPLTLIFENAGEVHVNVAVGKVGAIAATLDRSAHQANGMKVAQSHESHGPHGGKKRAVMSRKVDAKSVTVIMHRVSKTGVGEAVGTISLSDGPYGLVIEPNLKGISAGPKAIHGHTHGNCGTTGSGANLKVAGAAGGHFDPEGTRKNNGPFLGGALGDFPNLIAEADGRVRIPVVAPRAKLADIHGRSIVMHAGPDRYGATVQASSSGGHAGHGSHSHGGAKILCGIIP